LVVFSRRSCISSLNHSLSYMSAARLRVTVSTLQGKSSPLVISSSVGYSDFLVSCSSKLKVKAKRIWLVSGLELNAENFTSNLADGIKLIVSKGENYQSANKLPAESEANGTAVGLSSASATPASPVVIRVISRHSEVTPTAVNQLNSVARLYRDVRYAIGLPDLHEGQSLPIGSAIATSEMIYPQLIGTDIGCGMTLIATNLKAHKVSEKRLQRWVKRLTGLDEPWEGDSEACLQCEISWPNQSQVDQVNKEEKGLNKFGISLSSHLDNFGTIGGGNHFAELQCIERVEDEEEFAHLGLSKVFLFLMVHSGSRSLGEEIMRKYQQMNENAPHRGLQTNSTEFYDYMDCHRLACAFARRNRALIAKRFLAALGAGQSENEAGENQNAKPNQNENRKGRNEIEQESDDEEEEEEQEEIKEANEQTTDNGWSFNGGRCILDIWHNNVCQRDFAIDENKSEKLWLHRKGAAPADCGPIVIPGSRGDFSYLVKPIGDLQRSAFSLAHGAGRSWSRSKARAHLAQRHPNPAKLKFTELRSHVICEDKDLLYEEAPQAYKPVDGVIADLQEEGLIKVIAVLRPLITYKTRKSEDCKDSQ
jgi:release factor H-coupled RctB family protein